jgi:hypothetical protein
MCHYAPLQGRVAGRDLGSELGLAGIEPGPLRRSGTVAVCVFRERVGEPADVSSSLVVPVVA